MRIIAMPTAEPRSCRCTAEKIWDGGLSEPYSEIWNFLRTPTFASFGKFDGA